jgi:hypothetical protein
MDKLLDTYDTPKFNQEDINNLNHFITRNKIKAVIKSFPTKKSQGLDGLTAEFYQTTKELIPMFLILFYKIGREGMLPNSFYQVSITLITKTR